MPLVCTNLIKHRLHMCSLFIITIISLMVMFINIIWGNSPNARFHAWRIGTYGFSDHGSWRQPKKKRGKSGMVSNLQRNWGIFQALFLLICCCFNMVQLPDASTLGQNITLCAENWWNLWIMHYCVYCTKILVNHNIIYTCCLYTVRHDISLFVHGYRQIELDVVFPEAIHTSTILWFSTRESTSCIIVSFCFKILQLAVLFLFFCGWLLQWVSNAQEELCQALIWALPSCPVVCLDSKLWDQWQIWTEVAKDIDSMMKWRALQY